MHTFRIEGYNQERTDTVEYNLTDLVNKEEVDTSDYDIEDKSLGRTLCKIIKEKQMNG